MHSSSRWFALPLLLLVVAQAAEAGSQTAPEITDEQNDQKVTVNGTPSAAGTCGPVGQPTSCVYIPADIWTAWVEENVGSLHVAIELAQAPPSTFGDITYEFGFTAGTVTYAASGTVNQAAPAGDGAVSAGGVASEAELSGTQLLLTIPKANIPAAVPGMNLTQLYAASHATGGTSGEEAVSDRAPSTGYGTDFQMAQAAPANNTGPQTVTENYPIPTSDSQTTSTPPHQDPVPCEDPALRTATCPSSSTQASPLMLIDAMVGVLVAVTVTRRRQAPPL